MKKEYKTGMNKEQFNIWADEYLLGNMSEKNKQLANKYKGDD